MPRYLSKLNPDWRVAWQCRKCGYFDALFAFADVGLWELCPACGERDMWLTERVIVRWVSTAKWYNPLTWGSGHFEFKEAKAS